jgi:glycosyltransferase involved in cell wall biosynthesis
MRVLFVVRPNARDRVGGDVNVALYEKRGLEALGVTVEVAAELEPDARGYDVAHVFGVFDPEIAQPQIDACRRSAARLVVTPIWWDYFEFYGRSRGCERALAGAGARIEDRLRRVRATPAERFLRAGEKRKYARRLDWQRDLMRRADLLLPSSELEAHAVRRLGVLDRPTFVVHHPFEVPSRGDETAERRGVLCAARIEPKKNQAMLLYALADLDVEITLTGACFEPEYLKLCKRFMNDRVRWLGPVESRDEVLRLMSRTVAHVLPSWAELPGLSNLEAAAMGARVVVSNDGTEGEYFGAHAEYADPQDPATIRAAVERVLAMPPRERGDALDSAIARFNAPELSRKLLDAYRFVVSR